MIETVLPTILVGGRELSADHVYALRSVRVDLGMGLAGRATVQFDDFGLILSEKADFTMGTELSISVGSQVLMVGDIVGVALEQDFNETAVLTVTADDRSSRLAVTSRPQALLNYSLGDIFAQMAGRAGLSDRCSGLPPGAVAYQLQTGSDLDLLNALCARAGLTWWVEGKTLVVQRAGTTTGTVAVALGQAEGLDSFSVRATNSGADKVTVRGWDRDQTTVVTGEFMDPVTKESTFVGKAAGRGTSSRGAQNVVVTGSAPLTVAEAEGIARGRFMESASSAVVARGRGLANAAIKVGCAVTVTDAGPVDGTYAVTAVEHTYDGRGFLTHFTAGSVRPSGLVDLLAPAAPDPGLTAYGVYPGVVTDLDDKAKSGRVRVSFAVISDDVESEWARLVTLGAGKDRGLVLSPEVGDEVLIAFEDGDTRRPVVLGGLYSTTNTTPVPDGVASNKIKYRRIASRLGHLVELADGEEPAEQHLLLQLAGKKNKIRLGADKLDIVTDQTAVKVTNGQATVELASNGDIKLTGKNIELSASGEIKLTASTKVTVKGNAGVAVQGAQVQVKADGLGSVEAGGPLTIKGAMVAIN